MQKCIGTQADNRRGGRTVTTDGRVVRKGPATSGAQCCVGVRRNSRALEEARVDIAVLVLVVLLSDKTEDDSLSTKHQTLSRGD